MSLSEEKSMLSKVVLMAEMEVVAEMSIFKLIEIHIPFSHFRNNQHLKARNGEQGMGKKMYGKSGEHLIVTVPLEHKF